ncbi:MAG: hypothetical protein M3Y87_21500 [Myxococcota bacterium]|nr:hypothetical protein [Myxococcota bacterium]
MRKTTLWGTAIAGLALLGCSTGTEPGSAGADLAYVAESTIEDRADLFIDPASSWRPVTADQLQNGVESAIPVEIEIFEGVAVAWMRRDGSEAAERRAGDIVALYRVHDHVTGITPISDELDREDGGPVYVPGDDGGLAQIDVDLAAEAPAGNFDHVIDFALIDWLDLSRFVDGREAELWRELRENHPGC